jgi:hypothetical protein
MDGSGRQDVDVIHLIFEWLDDRIGNLVKKLVARQFFYILDRDAIIDPFLAYRLIIGHNDGNQAGVLVHLLHIVALACVED